ncbi:MAG: hypothetical protein ACLPVO_03500 [Desulfomonilaceae bacterium]
MSMFSQKCLEEILKIEPKAKVIIASGLPLSNEQTKLVINSGAKACVHKTYDMKDMLKIVRKVVDDD